MGEWPIIVSIKDSVIPITYFTLFVSQHECDAPFSIFLCFIASKNLRQAYVPSNFDKSNESLLIEFLLANRRLKIGR